MKKLGSFVLGVFLLVSPVTASAQTYSEEQRATLIAALQQLVIILTQQIQTILAQQQQVLNQQKIVLDHFAPQIPKQIPSLGSIVQPIAETVCSPNPILTLDATSTKPEERSTNAWINLKAKYSTGCILEPSTVWKYSVIQNGAIMRSDEAKFSDHSLSWNDSSDSWSEELKTYLSKNWNASVPFDTRYPVELKMTVGGTTNTINFTKN